MNSFYTLLHIEFPGRNVKFFRQGRIPVPLNQILWNLDITIFKNSR